MGNCIETCTQPWRGQEIIAEHIRFDEQDREVPKGEHEDDGGNSIKGVVRVKIVLTREELEWLMLQLSGSSNSSRSGVSNNIVKRSSLHDILEKIERGRSSSSSSPGGATWRPSLESIMEIPEVPDHMDRS